MRRLGWALSVAAVGLMLGATSPRADDSSTDADDKQEQQIRAALQKAPDLKDNHINVDVDDGIAALAGTVDSQREKQHATQLAHVEGVLGVNNRLVIRPGN
jgi:osmotically-inducible protein OsmY